VLRFVSPRARGGTPSGVACALARAVAVRPPDRSAKIGAPSNRGRIWPKKRPGLAFAVVRTGGDMEITTQRLAARSQKCNS
jgi:hypothetical protein